MVTLKICAVENTILYRYLFGVLYSEQSVLLRKLWLRRIIKDLNECQRLCQRWLDLHFVVMCCLQSLNRTFAREDLHL
jgi:hypothetical protein